MSEQGCKVKYGYEVKCDAPGEVCKPIEGHFCTECEVTNCKKMC